MICDEAFMSSALDVPIKGDQTYPVSTPAVEHQYDEDQNKWLRMVNLELCDRADLSSLMSNINFLQKLASVRLYCGATDYEPKEIDACLCLPTKIELIGTRIIFSYQLSPFGSVYDLLHQHSRPLDETSIAILFSRAVYCLAQLHSRGVLHRNLSTKHLLVNEARKEDSSNELAIQLCGLGSLTQFPLSCNILRNDLPPIHVSWRGWKLWYDKSMGSVSHPTAWYSPEMIGQDFVGYSWPSDIHSLGWILYELCTKNEPYVGLSPIQVVLEKLTNDKAPEIADDLEAKGYSNELIRVFQACVCRNPGKRPTANQLLHTPWVQRGWRTPLKRSLFI
ncbi:unnamed protein product [Echinostoma caproni]|uniref:Protein kinase domain-containing protein n=1 Tax=Echinostoma caproni TaxID=27848 RepID=A0A183AZ42_9TREM|nr:unnamed protein product [Echinostoma caproni]